MKDKLQFPFKRKGGNYLELIEDLGKDTMLGVKTVRATTRNTAIYFDDDGYTIQDAKKLASAIQDTYSDVTATADFGRNPYGEEVPFVFVDKVNSFTRESKMKKLNITKEQFEKSQYFKNKYGKLEYVSESGKVFKTNKGKVLKFKESKVDLKEDKPNSPDFKSWAEVEREIRAAIKYAEHKGHEACTVFDIGTWDQRNNKTLQEIIAKFKAKGYSCSPYPEEGSGYGIIDDGLGLSIVWGRFLESGGMKWRKFKESTKKFGKKSVKESVGDVSTDPAYICPYCGHNNSEFVDADDYPKEGYFDGATFNAQFWCNECETQYNVTFELKVKEVTPNEDYHNDDL